MKDKEAIEAMLKLLQTDIDASHSYGRAIEQVEDEIIRRRLETFMEEHRAHVQELSDLVRSMGGRPPEPSMDFKGHIMEGFTALRSVTGTKGALKALKAVEDISYQKYSEAVSREAPASVKEVLRRHFTEEKIHLEYIHTNLQALS